MNTTASSFSNPKIIRAIQISAAVFMIAALGAAGFAVAAPDTAATYGSVLLIFVVLAAGVLFGLGVYVLPTILAVWGGHRQMAAIVVLNILFGWTLIGWAVALIWSITESKNN